MGEEEKVCILATGSKASGNLWTGEDLTDVQDENGKILGLVLADGEKMVGVNFTQDKVFLLWTESGNIYEVDLVGNRYHKIGRPGRIHMVCSDGCDGGFVAVLAGGRPRVLYIETETGKIGWRVVEEEEVKGVTLDDNMMAVWGDTRVGLWRVAGSKSPQLLARLFATTSLAGVRLFKEREEQMAVTVTQDGKVVIWKMNEGSQPKLKSSVDLKVKVSALSLELPSSLFIATAEGIVQVDLGNLDQQLLLPSPNMSSPINRLRVFTPMAERPDSQELPQRKQLSGVVPQQMTDLTSQEAGPQGVSVDNLQSSPPQSELQASLQSESQAAREVSAQALTSGKPQALVHLQMAVLLLRTSSSPLHLVPGGVSDSNHHGTLVARVYKGVVDIFKVKDSFTSISKEDGSKKNFLHPTARQPEKAPVSDVQERVRPKKAMKHGSKKNTMKQQTPNHAVNQPVKKADCVKNDSSTDAPTKLKVSSAKSKTGPEPSKLSSACLKSKAAQSSRKAQEALQAELLDRIDRSSLLPLLRASTCGFPEKSRALVWTKLLQLPRNKRKHKRLLQAHSSSTTLQELLEVCWPDLLALPSLPLFIRPVSTLFSGHPTTEFECAAVLLKDFLLFGFSASAGPPDEVLQLTRSILSKEDPTLSSHLISLNASNRQLFWPLLSTGWSVVLPLKDWLLLWDHVVTAGPTLLPCLLVATLACLAPTLLSCGNTWMVGNLLNSTLGINMPKLLTLAHAYLERHWRVVEAIVPNHRPGIFSEGQYFALEGRHGTKGGEEGQRRVLKEVAMNSSKDDNNLRLAVETALSVSPPQVPRVASSKITLNTPHFKPTKMKPSRFIKKVPGPMEPLAPTYLPTDVLKGSSIEDIAAILGKAKHDFS